MRWLKPVNSWPAFAGEIAIIVIGVLIALGAEQLLDDWNWQRRIEAQKSALDEDVAGMWSALSARLIVQPCVDRRLEELKLVFARKDRGVPLGIAAPIGRPAKWSGSQAALRMATADGSLSHMKFDDKQAYFGVSESYDTFATSMDEERASWRVLQALNEPGTLDDADWRELRRAYRDASESNRIMKIGLVADRPGVWLTAFSKFPNRQDNKDALAHPFVQELCRPAVRK